MIPVALQNFRTYKQAVDFYKECEKVKLPHTLRSQLTRATESIVLNLAEGSAKPTPRDRARYYAIALASFRECQAILTLSSQDAVAAQFDPMGGSLYKLSRIS